MDTVAEVGTVGDARAVDTRGSTERYLDMQNARLGQVQPGQVHPLDSVEAQKRHKQLLEWYHQEREKQSANRYQMAIDQDFYDNLQWDEQDIAELEERGQAAYVFNEIAPTIDWIIGTEKRTRVDYRVLPREEEDVQTADLKTKTLKYLSDVNRTAFARSLAFADAVKVGVGWIESGVRQDPTEEAIFTRYEDWRKCLWDSMGVERDGNDWRYFYRWKFLDLDIAEAMFPDRRAQLKRAAVAANIWGNEEDEDFWYLGQRYQVRDLKGEVIGRRTYINDSALVDNRRARVKVIECWYRMPTLCRICRGGEYNGQEFDPAHEGMKQASLQGTVSLFDKITLKTRVAIMTETDLLDDLPSPYKHDRFPFTPVWGYVRGRDRMVYGAIRRVRDPQEDMNKRHSKALHLMSTNGIVADVDALDGTGLTWDDVREEAARPDYLLTKKKGSDLKIERHVDLAEPHLMLMDKDGRMIRQAGGVTDDNLGRATNAISGEAIKARQLQGSVVTAELFDNLRFAVQVDGEKQLSLTEQYMTQPKVMRLTGSRGKLDWFRINQPEVQPDGSVRFLNDITARTADFVVDEQDYHQSVRQAMFETMVELVGRISAINAEAGLRILRMALEFSDLPNKEEMAGEVKNMLGIVDEKDLERMSPEQKMAYQATLKEKEQLAQLQKQDTINRVNEGVAKIEKITAEAEKNRAQASESLAKAVSTAQASLTAVQDLAAIVTELRDAVLNVLPANA